MKKDNLKLTMMYQKIKFMFLLLLAVGCGSLNKLNVPAPLENTVVVTNPKTTLDEKIKRYWLHKDPKKDGIAGISLEKAYEFLKGKPHQTVIVGINDSGIALAHEALVPVLWVNKGEIPNNKKDDDGNGYPDDVNGWNFLGGIYDENLEVTRLYKKEMKKFDGKDKNDIPSKDKKAYESYLEKKAEIERELPKAKKNLKEYEGYLKMVEKPYNAIVKKLGKENFTVEEVKNLPVSIDLLPYEKNMMIQAMKMNGSIKEEIENIKEGINYYRGKLSQYDIDFYPRKTILKDDPTDFITTVYGNANPSIYSPYENHGTHVAGIVAAKKKGEKGAKGVCRVAKIMAVRTVPNGDEYDKDVALSIRYAVDNGAKVINTSFGKGYSPNVEVVYDAILYAAKKDVLIVNAAGNDGKNIDEKLSYPNDAPDFKNEIADNMITVGASTFQYNENIIADFSNYGKMNVDIFAPGQEIYSSVPYNKYRYLQGTSMAAPVVAGVAALIRAYYPELSARQVKHILMNSGQKIDFKVKKPGGDSKVLLNEISVSGRILNAYNAVRMADKMK